MEEMHSLWLTKWQMGCCGLQCMQDYLSLFQRRQSSGDLNFTVAASQHLLNPDQRYMTTS